jgi:uracil-DNA glycosylase family protein
VAATKRTRGSTRKTDGDDQSLDALRLRASTCKRCDLWKTATQTVFGDGDPHAELMLVGEQPGDVEDRQGEPFVGPAGKLLRKALAEAGIDERRVYLTNAVKHFKWTPRGKRRLHDRPNHDEVLACHLWLEAEIAAVKPRVLVALGATAANALLGSSVRVTRDRAQPLESPLAEVVTVTVHPSSILRSPDSDSRAAAFAQFVDDLRRIVRLGPAGATSPVRKRKL